MEESSTADGRPPTSTLRGRAASLAWAWLPVLVWMLVIFVLSSRQDQSGGLPGVALPKLAHVVEYAILGFLVARAMRSEHEPMVSGRTLVVMAIVAGYAVSDELHQAFVPTREARPTDVLVDIVGGLIGVVAWATLARRRRRRA